MYMAHTNHAYTSVDFLNATEICCRNRLLQLKPPNSRHHWDFVEGLFSFWNVPFVGPEVCPLSECLHWRFHCNTLFECIHYVIMIMDRRRE